VSEEKRVPHRTRVWRECPGLWLYSCIEGCPGTWIPFTRQEHAVAFAFQHSSVASVAVPERGE
jgi:hypothetical protein